MDFIYHFFKNFEAQTPFARGHETHLFYELSLGKFLNNAPPSSCHYPICLWEFISCRWICWDSNHVLNLQWFCFGVVTFQILDILFKVLTSNRIIRRWGSLFTCNATMFFGPHFCTMVEGSLMWSVQRKLLVKNVQKLTSFEKKKWEIIILTCL
jgi:hypothetical protein